MAEPSLESLASLANLSMVSMGTQPSSSLIASYKENDYKYVNKEPKIFDVYQAKYIKLQLDFWDENDANFDRSRIKYILGKGSSPKKWKELPRKNVQTVQHLGATINRDLFHLCPDFWNIISKLLHSTSKPVLKFNFK